MLSSLVVQVSHCAPLVNLLAWCRLSQQKAMFRQTVSNISFLSPVHRQHVPCGYRVGVRSSASAAPPATGWLLGQETQPILGWSTNKPNATLLCSAELLLMFLQMSLMHIWCMSIGLGGEDWAALQQHMIRAHGSNQSCVPYHF